MNNVSNKTVLKYIDYIKENKELTSEIEVREFLKEETNEKFKQILNNLSDRFTMDNINLEYDENNIDENFKKVNEIKHELIETLIDVVIDNIKDFNKTWEDSDEKIEQGDTVVSIHSDEEYFVSRFGQNNNFYDNNKHVFVDLDTVKKK